MEHLNLELILQYINKNAEENSITKIEKHLSACDQCFLTYSIHKTSLDNIESNQLPNPAQETLKAIKPQNIAIDNALKRTTVQLIINKIKDFIYNPIMGPALATCCIALFIYISWSDQSLETPLNNNTLRSADKNDDIPEGFIRIPDLKNLHIATIIDTLTKLDIKYEIIYNATEFKQIPSPTNIIMPLKNTIIIYFTEKELNGNN